VEQVNKADTDVRRAMQVETLKRDLSKARSLREIVLGEIRNGVAPTWIATKYGHMGVTLERVLAAKAAIDKQAERRDGNALHGRNEGSRDQAEEGEERHGDAFGELGYCSAAAAG
jgi:phage gpG-like protein